MKLNLLQLLSQQSDSIGFDYTIDLSGEEVFFQRVFRDPVRISGQVTGNAGVIYLSGSIDAAVYTNCARCGKPLVCEKSVPVSFVLARSAGDEDIDDIWVIDSDQPELDDIFVSELLLDMDMAVLCDQDCKGVCSVCGANLNDGECGCERRQADPRLQKLSDFLEDLKNK